MQNVYNNQHFQLKAMVLRLSFGSKILTIKVKYGMHHVITLFLHQNCSEPMNVCIAMQLRTSASQCSYILLDRIRLRLVPLLIYFFSATNVFLSHSLNLKAASFF